MVPRNHTSWLFPVENCPDFNSLLSLTFVYRLTYSVLELGQAKGMILYIQLRGEKKKRSLKEISLIKSRHFQENRQEKQTSGSSAYGRFPGLVCKAMTHLRDGRPHLEAHIWPGFKNQEPLKSNTGLEFCFWLWVSSLGR